ncbi:MAG: hypothetical protein WDN06_09825 [Asticcacaulis sp.]
MNLALSDRRRRRGRPVRRLLSGHRRRRPRGDGALSQGAVPQEEAGAGDAARRRHNRHIEAFADACVEIETSHLEASLLPQMAKVKQRVPGARGSEYRGRKPMIRRRCE